MTAPLWALRALPYGAMAAALLGAVWWIDRAGYQRASAERDRREAAMIAALRTELRGSEARLAHAIDGMAADYERQRAGIARAARQLQPIFIEETARDPRLSDPALGLTPGLLDAVNRARAAGACAAAPAGGIACALPAAGAGD